MSRRAFKVVPVVYSARTHNVGSETAPSLVRYAREAPVGDPWQHPGSEELTQLLAAGWVIVAAHAAGGGDKDGVCAIFNYILERVEEA